MIPLSRAASFTKAELGVRQLPGSPASVDPPNTENRSAPGRIRRGEQRITASRGGATISAFQRFSLSVFSTSAFTLIEMIVVMLIIATLAALLMGAATSVFDRARRTQAKNDVIQIVTAINAFYTEYGRYPVTLTSTTTDAFVGAGSPPAGCTNYTSNDVLFNVLRNYTGGSDSANVAALNPRQIVFLSPGGAKNTTPPRGGIATDNRYYDPWGSQYAIVIDTNYDNTITNPYSDTDGSAGTTPLRFGAVAYSYGKNGALGGGSASSPYTSEGGSAGKFKGSSDILSW